MFSYSQIKYQDLECDKVTFLKKSLSLSKQAKLHNYEKNLRITLYAFLFCL